MFQGQLRVFEETELTRLLPSWSILTSMQNSPRMTPFLDHVPTDYDVEV